MQVQMRFYFYFYYEISSQRREMIWLKHETNSGIMLSSSTESVCQVLMESLAIIGELALPCLQA